jgi:PAS domain S-box-containing protein
MEVPRITPPKGAARIFSILPFIFAILVFLYIANIGRDLVAFPDDGIELDPSTGEILSYASLDPGPAKLDENDIITKVDGIPYSAFGVNYMELDKEGGESIEMEIRRGEELITRNIDLVKPSQTLIFNRLTTVLVALVFWGIGLGIEAFKPSARSSSVEFLWFETCALILSASAASTMGIVWASIFSNSLMWLLGPLTVHFHTHFPQPVIQKTRPYLLMVLYAIAALAIVLIVLVGLNQLGISAVYSNLRFFGRLFLAANLILVIGLLVYSYRTADTPGSRGKVRLVLLGVILVALPFVTLTILPNLILNEPLIPYPIAFMVLGILPITYGYSIFRLHMIEIDQVINRGATYILVYSTLGGFYLVLYALLNPYIPDDTRARPLLNTFLVLVLASVFFPLQRWMQRNVDRLFYGGWYDYRIGIRQITENLTQITDLRSLALTISQRLTKTLRLEEAVVFFRDQDGEFSVVESFFNESVKDREKRDFPVLPRSSLTYLMKIGAIERVALLQSLSQVSLTPEELQLMNTEQIHLWAPVVGHVQIQGLLALGPKLGGDIFSGEDLDILRVVVQQLSPIIENIHLLNALKAHANELELRVDERTAELHDAKERVEAILASVGDGVIVTDLEGHILTVNQAFEQLSGYSSSEIQGKNLFNMLADDNGITRISAMREALTIGETWRDELTGRRRSGSQYSIQFTIAPIHDPQGNPVGFVGSQTDITHQKDLDRMKDAFISDVSHELRTPITNISLYIELLKTAPEDRYARYLNVVRDQSELLNKLVEDILDLSRLTASKTRPVAFSKADLNTIVEQVIHAYRPLAEVSGVLLELVTDQDLPPVYVEPNQIARMVTNLVTNAIRYSPKGEVHVMTTHNGDWVCFKVRDTGIGIDPEDLPHLFERFFRGRNVRQSEMHGTGLGLAIVKEIVDFHGGTIEVRSKYNEGSTFEVWLPVNPG